MTSPSDAHPVVPASRAPCKPYSAPRLLRLIDVRELTLGGSVGNGDSGSPNRQARIGGV